MHCTMRSGRIICVHHSTATGWMTLWIWHLLQPWKNIRTTIG
jgi:hypothetical protein